MRLAGEVGLAARRILGMAIVARHALSLSSPRAASDAPLRASGLDRSARPSKGAIMPKNGEKRLAGASTAYVVGCLGAWGDEARRLTQWSSYKQSLLPLRWITSDTP